MNECKFCAGEKIEFDSTKEGWRTPKQNIDILRSMFMGDLNEEPTDYIQWEQKRLTMWVQSSSGEYADIGFDIQYCPYCGKKLTP